MQIKTFKHLGLISVLFVTILLVSNIASSKILLLGPFTFDGGTILFPLSYIFGDVLTEVYGYAQTRRIIWSGFAMLLLASLVFYLVGLLPSSPDWAGQASYDQILGQVPRIVLASVLAFFAGAFSNSFVLARMKVKTKGRLLWLRTIGSTLVGEGIDTAVFVLVAFGGTLSDSLLTSVMISSYIFKVGVEVLFTPFTYAIIEFLKKSEKEDYYDRRTNFNPFKLKVH